MPYITHLHPHLYYKELRDKVNLAQTTKKIRNEKKGSRADRSPAS